MSHDTEVRNSYVQSLLLTQMAPSEDTAAPGFATHPHSADLSNKAQTHSPQGTRMEVAARVTACAPIQSLHTLTHSGPLWADAAYSLRRPVRLLGNAVVVASLPTQLAFYAHTMLIVNTYQAVGQIATIACEWRLTGPHENLQTTGKIGADVLDDSVYGAPIVAQIRRDVTLRSLGWPFTPEHEVQAELPTVIQRHTMGVCRPPLYPTFTKPGMYALTVLLDDKVGMQIPLIVTLAE